MEINKKVIMIDLVLVLGSLLIISSLIGYARPLVIAPIDNYVSNGSVLFDFKNADKIFIDDNLEFSSPDEYRVEDDLIINLKPGEYYWKISGVLESEVRQFTVQSEIILKLIKNNGGYEVVNSGNEKLNVDVFNNGKLSGNIILDIDKSGIVEGDKFIGGKADG